MPQALQDPIAGKGAVVKAPHVVDDASSVNWTEEAGIVVVGFGGAGAAAALEAREQGADVLVVEQFEGGGATAYSGGIYYAGNTRFQRDAGVQDSPQDLFDYLSLEMKGSMSVETLRRFCDESGRNIEWLVHHGVGFEGSLYSGKTTYPPEDKYLYYSGNEKIPAFAAKAKPAPRGHRTVGNGFTGYAFFEALKKSVYEHNIKVRTHSRVIRLVTDATGAVIGIEILQIEKPQDQKKHQALYTRVDPARPFNTLRADKAMADGAALENAAGARKFIRARHAVILAAGGFTNNLEMVRWHMPLLAVHNESLIRLGSMGCNGSGIQLGVSAGGSVAKLDRAVLVRSIAPPNVMVQGLIVNRHGCRFVNEDVYTASLGDAILRQPDGNAWIVVDKALYRALLRQCMPTADKAFSTFKYYTVPVLLNLLFGGTKQAKTLAELARKTGIDAAGLEKTVADNNAAINGGEPDPAGKNTDNVRRLGEGPYRAINTSVGNKFSFCRFLTLGGLRVDERLGLVLRDDGTPIQGLYAAGRTAVGLPTDGYISGFSLADCIFSGRRAGLNAAVQRQYPS